MAAAVELAITPLSGNHYAGAANRTVDRLEQLLRKRGVELIQLDWVLVLNKFSDKL